MMDGKSLTVAQAVKSLETLYPLKYAEEWDHPGLIVGDPSDFVNKIYCAVDPTFEVVQEAIEWGADLLLTHHPLFFRSTHSVSGDGFRGEIVNLLVRNHCALWVGHTNADCAHRGVSEALADVLDIENQKPLVPIDDPQSQYAVGLGRVGELKEPLKLKDLAFQVSQILPPTQRGVDVAGDLEMLVSRVAVLGGSGDSLFDEVRASGADVYITSDLRHHPVVDARQEALHKKRLESQLSGKQLASGALAFINTPHYASEKLWFHYAIDDIPARIFEDFGQHIEIKLSQRNTDPFTAHFGQSFHNL